MISSFSIRLLRALCLKDSRIPNPMGVEMEGRTGQNQIYDSKALLDDFDGILKIARKVGVKLLENDTIEQIIIQSRAEYERLIPQLPYVGGETSPFTPLMIQSGQTIAVYRVCKDIGLENEQIGELIYETAKAQMQTFSRFKKWFARRLVFSQSYRNRWRKATEESQNREFAKNWVGEFVEGNGKDFEYGFDFLECGFLKLAREYGCEEIAPYACLCDFVRMRALGVGFRRTQTLAMGHPRCDFRFLKDYETPRGWPLESLEEVRNSPRRR